MDAKKWYIIGDLKNCLWFEDIKYALINRGNSSSIACYRPCLKADEHGVYFTEWDQGHYFFEYNAAKNYIKDKLNDYLLDLISDASDVLETIKSL